MLLSRRAFFAVGPRCPGGVGEACIVPACCRHQVMPSSTTPERCDTHPETRGLILRIYRRAVAFGHMLKTWQGCCQIAVQSPEAIPVFWMSAPVQLIAQVLHTARSPSTNLLWTVATVYLDAAGCMLTSNELTSNQDDVNLAMEIEPSWRSSQRLVAERGIA